MRVYTRFHIAVVSLLSPLLLLAAAGAAWAQQQNYPTRPVRYIIPFPPGGSTDPMGRFIAGKLTEKWGHSVVVDNRPGGNTVIGTEVLARAQPDGYTIGWSGASMFSTPSLMANLPYDVARDFAPIATIATGRSVLVVHPTVPANTLQEFAALMKSKPGEFNYGSSGVGTNTHLSGELFNQMAGTKMVHIPYKGSGPVTTDLLAARAVVVSGADHGDPVCHRWPVARTGDERRRAPGRDAHGADVYGSRHEGLWLDQRDGDGRAGQGAARDH